MAQQAGIHIVEDDIVMRQREMGKGR